MNDVDNYTLRKSRAADGSAGLQLAGSVLLPGVAMVRRSPVAALSLFVLGVALPLGLAVAVVANRERIIGIALDRDFLLAIAVLAVVAVIVRFAAVAEIAHLFGGTRFIRSKVSVASLVVAAMGVVAVWVAVLGLEARAAIAEVFGEGSETPVSAIAGPSDATNVFTAADGNEDPDATGRGESVVNGEASPSDVASSERAASSQAVNNILILGADSGAGREGVRTDTMMLVSVHAASGRTSIISIPRNLARLQFPEGTPLGDRYPDGYDGLANALFTTVSGSAELTEKYGAYGFDAEPIALASAIGHSLDVQIDDFVLIDMLGFAGVIDAVGGVTVELCQSVSLPPSLPGEDPVEPLIGPGQIDMNGVTALAYARTRYADSDYERTGRQRQLMAALGSQVSIVDALQAFTTVTKVLDESLRTSLTADEFDRVLRRLGENSSIVESVGLVPPLVEPGRPDYEQLQEIVAAVRTAIVTGEPSGYAPAAEPIDPDNVPDACAPPDDT